MSREIDFLGEGPTDDAMARKVIEAVSGRPGATRRTPQSGSGKGSLDRRLKGINAGLRHSKRPILVLRDLDEDAPCPSALILRLLENKDTNMFLRICVRESESWLLADARAYADFCGIKVCKIPQLVDDLKNPKEMILAWKGRASKLSRHLVEGSRMGIPRWAALATWNLSFIERKWDPMRAYDLGSKLNQPLELARGS